MQPTGLNGDLAKVITADRLEEAEHARRSRVEWSAVAPDPFPSVTVRLARPSDAADVLRLAQLEGHGVPLGPMLVAEVSGELLAARSLVTGKAIADPFRPTAHLVELLELRSAHLREGGDESRRLARGRARSVLRALSALAHP